MSARGGYHDLFDYTRALERRLYQLEHMVINQERMLTTMWRTLDADLYVDTDAWQGSSLQELAAATELYKDTYHRGREWWM